MDDDDNAGDEKKASKDARNNVGDAHFRNCDALQTTVTEFGARIQEEMKSETFKDKCWKPLFEKHHH